MTVTERLAAVALLFAPLWEPVSVAAQAVPQSARTPDVIYVPTPQPVVEAMLEIAGVKKGDILYDLGSGDGRIPITAARKFGIRAIEIDIDPERSTRPTPTPGRPVSPIWSTSQRGPVPGQLPRSERRDALSASTAQREAAAQAAARAEVRDAYRQPCVPHGRLAARGTTRG